MGRILLAALTALALASCSATSTQTAATVATAVASSIAPACATASQTLGVAQGTVKGGALNTVNSIGTYVTAACATGEAMAAIATNPDTVAWLGQLNAGLGALVQAAKAPSSAPAS